MRIERLRSSPVVNDLSRPGFSVVSGHLVQHPLRWRDDNLCTAQSIGYSSAIGTHPRRVVGFSAVDCDPPAHNVTVCHNNLGYVGVKSAVAILTEMKEIGTNFVDEEFKIPPRFGYIAFGHLHPFEPVLRWPIVDTGQSLHPSSLVRKWQFAETDQSDLMAVLRKPRNEFLRVCPDPADRVGGDQYVHSSSSMETGS